MNKQLRKRIRAQLVKDLRDLEQKHTPIANMLNKLADEFNCKRSEILEALSKDENEKPKTFPPWPNI